MSVCVVFIGESRSCVVVALLSSCHVLCWSLSSCHVLCWSLSSCRGRHVEIGGRLLYNTGKTHQVQTQQGFTD